MNKGELVESITIKLREVNQKVTKKDAELVLNAAIDSIAEAVASGDKVTLVGFGTFEPRVRKAREGRNPKTGESMTIPETIAPTFTAGKIFKEQVSSKRDLAKV